jgi:hypothetical protein
MIRERYMPKKVTIVNIMIIALTGYSLVMFLSNVIFEDIYIGLWGITYMMITIISNIMIIYGIINKRYWVVYLIFIISVLRLLNFIPAVISSILVAWPGAENFSYYLFGTTAFLAAILVFLDKEVRMYFVKENQVLIDR